jgi:hypothetical protein
VLVGALSLTACGDDSSGGTETGGGGASSNLNIGLAYYFGGRG